MNILFVTPSVNYVVEQFQDMEEVNMKVMDCSQMIPADAGKHEAAMGLVSAKIRFMLESGDIDALVVYDCPFFTPADILSLPCKDAFLVSPQEGRIVALKKNDAQDGLETIAEKDIHPDFKKGDKLYNDIVEYWTLTILDVFLLKRYNVSCDFMPRGCLDKRILEFKCGADRAKAFRLLNAKQYDCALKLARKTVELGEAIYGQTIGVSERQNNDISFLSNCYFVAARSAKQLNRPDAANYFDKCMELLTGLAKYYEAVKEYKKAWYKYLYARCCVFSFKGKDCEEFVQLTIYLKRVKLLMTQK